MKVLIRCDANLSIGAGHVMRCLALAQELKKSGHHVDFAFTSIADNIIKRLKEEGFDCFPIKAKIGSREDAEQCIVAARKREVVWVVTDGYYFKTSYQKSIKRAGFRLLCIDDIAECAYLADIVLNQNPGFSVDDYKADKATRFLLGPSYALLRREFRLADPSKRKREHILITMGGTDPNNLTGQVLEALNGLSVGKIIVLLSSINPNIEKIKKMQSQLNFLIEVVVDADNVVPYMLGAKLAIHAAGCTSWELAYLGIPGICYILAENQRCIAFELGKSGFSYNMGQYNEFCREKLRATVNRCLDHPEQLMRMARAGRSLVDGKGVQRVIKELSNGDN